MFEREDGQILKRADEAALGIDDRTAQTFGQGHDRNHRGRSRKKCAMAIRSIYHAIERISEC
jgi:hypothetical protein